MGAMARSPTAFRRLLYIAAIPTAAFVVFAIWLLAGWGSPPEIRLVDFVGALGPSVFAAVSTGEATRRTRGRQRQAWLLMTIGLAGWVFAEVMVIYHRYWRASLHPLYPSAANIGFLLFPVAACIAMLVFPVGYPGGARFRMVLDGAIVAASLFVVAWVVVLRQTYASTGVKNSAAIVVAGLSGVGDHDRYRCGFSARPRPLSLAC